MIESLEDRRLLIAADSDYGDAPSNFAQIASHLAVGPMLGTIRDMELGTQVSLNATGDDVAGLDGEDDEDGVTWETIYLDFSTASRNSAKITISSPQTSTFYVAAWIDFDKNGIWDSTEKVLGRSGNVVGTPLTQVYPLTINPMYYGQTTIGSTFARVRVWQAQPISDSPAGNDSTGEVEDYQVLVAGHPGYDYGGAPSSYNTDSASHVAFGPRLGAIRDAVLSDLVPVNADGDGDGLDEDGVTQNGVAFGAIDLANPATHTFTVDLQNIALNPGNVSEAKLSAWIDWDRNGAFDSINPLNGTLSPDFILDKVTVTNGLASFPITIPANVQPGLTYARFRLSSVPVADPNNATYDGEIEDYALTIVAAPTLTPLMVVSTSFDATGTLSNDATSLELIFNENVVGATNVENYKLTRAGADGLLGTSDDVEVEFAGAGSNSNTASYQFNPGVNGPLVEDVYRFKLEDDIIGTDGSKLDGDGDGIAGGDWQRDFVVVAPPEFSDGTLDSSFGTSGIIKTLDSGANNGFATTIQSDGKILVVGSGTDDTGYRRIAVSRFNPLGSLDESFGVNGKIIVSNPTSPKNERGTSVTVQPDGKILISGDTIEINGVSDFLLMRLNSDGSIDTTFGTFGRVMTDFASPYDYAADLKTLPDGKIIVVGSRRVNSEDQFAIAKYDSNGLLDSSFGNGGKVTTTFLTSEYESGATGISIDSNSKIVVSGYTRSQDRVNGYFSLARYNPDGTLDSTFGISGKATTDFGYFSHASGLAIQSDGKIVLTGSSYNASGFTDIALARYTTSGVLDLSFGINGTVHTSAAAYFDRAFDLAVQGDDRLVVVGSADFLTPLPNGSRKFAVLRYTSNGSLDTTFGENGIIVPDLGLRSEEALSVAIQDDGKIVVGGYSGDLNQTNFALIQILTGQSVINLFRDNGSLFDIDSLGFGSGQLLNGTSNAFDGLNRLKVGSQDFAPITSAQKLIGEPTVVIPSGTYAGLNVSREITVPTTGVEDFARTVDSFTNPTSDPITTTVTILGNLGSDAATTVFKTSDDDSDIETADQWIGTDDANAMGGSPAIIHYIHGPHYSQGPNGLEPVNVEVIGDNIQWTYSITVDPGQTVRLAHFTILAATRQAAINAANVLVTTTAFGGEAAAYLTDPLANFVFFAPPTEIVLDAFPTNVLPNIVENEPANSVITTLSTIDNDVGDLHIYTIVPGFGDAHNAAFAITGNQLRLIASPDYETQEEYLVRVRVTDSHGLSFEKPLKVFVTNISEELFWTGDGDGVNWNDPANWSTNTLPTANDDVFISAAIGSVHISGQPAHVAAIHTDRSLSIDSGGVLEIGGDVLNPSGLGFELLVSGTFSVINNATLQHANLTFVGVNGPTSNLISIAAGKTLTVDTNSIIRASTEGVIAGAGTLHNLGTINPNVGFGGAPSELRISVASLINDGVVSTSQVLVPGSQTPARLLISSSEFRNYGTIQINGAADAIPNPGVSGLLITSSLFVNAGHLITELQGSAKIQATNWRNYDVVGPETWYGWINNQGLMELGGALDNTNMTLLLGTGTALLSGSIQGGSVNKTLLNMRDPITGRPIAMPPLHKSPLSYGSLALGGGQLNPVGLNARLRDVSMGPVALFIDTSNVLSIQGTVSFGSRGIVDGLDNIHLLGDLRVDQDATIVGGTIGFNRLSFGNTANFISIAEGKTLTIGQSTFVRAAIEGAISGAGTLRNLGTINPNIGFNGVSTSLVISVGTFVNDGVVSTSPVLVPGSQTPAKLLISSSEFRNYGTIQINGAADAIPNPGVSGLLITSSLFVNAGHLITELQGSAKIQATNWRNYDVVGPETWYGWINNQGLMELGGALDNTNMTLLLGTGTALLSGSIQGGSVNKTLLNLRDPGTGQPIAMPPLHKDPLRYGLVGSGGTLLSSGQSALLNSVSMGSVLMNVTQGTVLSVQGTVGFGSRRADFEGSLDNIQLFGELRVAQDTTLPGGVVTFSGSGSGTATNVISIANGKTLTLGANSTVRSNNTTGAIVGAGTLRNLGTINPNVGFGGTPSEVQISVASFINDGVVSTSQVLVPSSQTPAKLLISSNQFTNNNSIQIGGTVQPSQQVGLTISSSQFSNFGTLSTTDNGKILLSGVTVKNYGDLNTGASPLDTASETRIDVDQFFNYAGAILKGSGTFKATSGFVNDAVVRSITNTNVPIVFSTAVSGTGSFEGYEVDFAGSTNFGAGPTQTNFDTRVFLQATNTAHFQLGGASPGTGYDQMDATSNFSIGGNLVVSLINGFNPQTNDRFVLLRSQTVVTGTFANVSLPSIPGRTLSLIYTLNTVEVVVSPVINFYLPVGAGANNLALRRRSADDYIELFDLDNSSVVLDTPTSTTNRIIINGQNIESESLTVDYQYGGFFALPDGIQFNGGTGAGDELIIKGTGATSFSYLSTGGSLGNASIQSNDWTASNSVSFTGVEPLSILNAIDVNVFGALNVGTSSFTIDSQSFTTLGDTTTLSGGSINASNGLILGAGQVLHGSGTIASPIYSERGSTITATGSLALGDANAFDGVELQGRLNVGANTVTLNDAFEAVLGVQTSIGTSTVGGTLIAPNGITLLSNQTVVGRGVISTPNGSFENQGLVQGNSTGVTFNQLVTGAGRFAGNVTFNGGTSFGNSPTLTTIAGNATFTSSNVATVEIGGLNPGTGYDQVSATGNISLAGSLNVILIQLNNGYVPAVGHSLILYSAASITGTFANVTFPQAAEGTRWKLDYSATQVKLTLIPSNAPKIEKAEINGDSSLIQRSMVQSIKITFNSIVTLQPSAISVTLVDGPKINPNAPETFNTPVTLAPLSMTNINGKTTVVVRFANNSGNLLSSLADGKYKLFVNASLVRDSLNDLLLDGDANGVEGGDYVYHEVDAVTAQSVDSFFRLLGDQDGDRFVDSVDYLIFARSYNKSIGQTGYQWYFDFDSNGVVNATDKTQMDLRRNRYSIRR